MSRTAAIIALDDVAMPRLDVPPAVNVRRTRAALGISRERMARLLDLTAKTVTRLEEQERLPTSSATLTRLAKVQEIVDLGLVVFTPEGFIQFMSTPFPAFRGLTAIQLIERDEPDQVFGALVSLYEGTPS